MNTIPIEHPKDLKDYTLLDSGDGEKLETISGYTMIRPDPRALWSKSQPETLWKNAHAHYVQTQDKAEWKIIKPPPNPWYFHFKDYQFLLRPTDFKHVGIFPEQAVNWEWMTTIIGACHSGLDPESHDQTQDSCFRRNDIRPLNILNLFAYTGGASVVCSKNGAHITHVDSVKGTINWAHENAERNHIPHERIRWIEDDAYKFVMREGKRGKTYDGLIMDPPRFGRGSKGEIWKLEDDLPTLLSACKSILSPNPLFILINAYTADLSSIVLSHLIKDLTKGLNGTITFGELATKEDASQRLLPQGIFGRFEGK